MNQIERQVDVMRANGIIRPRVSPYSSSVVLMRKADGTWEALKQNYRQKDMYLILVINALLDELQDAKYFSKLDLRNDRGRYPEDSFKAHRDIMSTCDAF